MCAGLGGMFASGLWFDLFETRIDFAASPGFYAFYGSIWLAVFGVFFRFAPARLAFVFTVLIAGIFLAIFVAGKWSRGEL